MHHRAPETLIEFYSQQIQRGSAGPQFDYLYYKNQKYLYSQSISSKLQFVSLIL